jgi:hypothetical protein
MAVEVCMCVRGRPTSVYVVVSMTRGAPGRPPRNTKTLAQKLRHQEFMASWTRQNRQNV